MVKKRTTIVSIISLVCIVILVSGCVAQPGQPEQNVQMNQTVNSPPGDAVELYGIWETTFINANSYSNTFDFREIELQATFTSPSGATTNFFGFYDGDGAGGQEGTVWKLRFMPTETGTYTYTYRWTGTGIRPPGGTGNFTVTDTGKYRGPLRIASDNPWYFEDSRGQPFDYRGYGMHHFLQPYGAVLPVTENTQSFTDAIQSHAASAGYTMIMVDCPVHRVGTEGATESWWYGSSDDQFTVEVWDAWEEVLDVSMERGIYVLPFAGMVSRGDPKVSASDFQYFARYWVARFGPYHNFFGWSLSWEVDGSGDGFSPLYSPSELNSIYTNIEEINPFGTLLTCHDHSGPEYERWMDFSMRQYQADSIESNCRTCGVHDGAEPPFDNRPIIGSEDIWECDMPPLNTWGLPQNAHQFRMAAWGEMMAGVMPMYEEWTQWTSTSRKGNGIGEPEIIRLFDFWYSMTDYRHYRQLNDLVSRPDGQICSGIPGEEYLVYDANGGSIAINLRDVPATTQFRVVWFNPATGAQTAGEDVSGGGLRTLTPPRGYSAPDTVLLLDIGPFN